MSKYGIDNSSRGYCGWYLTKFNENIYLRSKLEFIIARWLENKNIIFSMEKEIYNINGKNYKPDFIIYSKTGEVRRIIEVKCCENDRISYLNMFSIFFKNRGISYYVIGNKHINKILRYNSILNNEVKKWIKNSAKIIHDMKGEKNPHFGMKHSEETKKLIGKKTKERFQNEEFKANFKNIMILKMKEFKNDSKKYEKYIANMKERLNSEEFKLNSNKIKYFSKIENRICKVCNKNFNAKILYNKNTNKLKEKQYEYITCSSKCSGIYYAKNKQKICTIKREIDKNKQIELLYTYKVKYNKIPMRSEFKEICKTAGILYDIRTTYGTYTNLLNELEKYEDKKNYTENCKQNCSL